MSRKTECSKKKMKISVKRRLKLIDMVEHQNMSVVRASKKLELKVCTARSILTKYKKKGLIYDKKEKKHIPLPPPAPEPQTPQIVIKQEDAASPEPEQPWQVPVPAAEQQHCLPIAPYEYPMAPKLAQSPNMFYVWYYF